jgi:hypothetical protein
MESAIAGALAEEAQAIGRHPGFADVLIAASARALDAVILTANPRHFEPLRAASRLALVTRSPSCRRSPEEVEAVCPSHPSFRRPRAPPA